MPCKILVIEDEEHINELICLNLETAGYEPVPFFDGAALSSHLRENPAVSYDQALLDVMHPGHFPDRPGRPAQQGKGAHRRRRGLHRQAL